MDYIEQTEQINKQAGMTLMEIIAALAVMAVIIIGALSLYNSASSSQATTQMVQDVTALRSSVKQLWLGQGSYGAAAGTVLNDTLVTAKRIPTTIKIGTGTPKTLTHSLNGTITITGYATNFTISLTNITPEVCVPLLTSAQDWASVKVGTSGTARTPPITPADAASDCAGTDTVLFTSVN